jgi:hypothetical protein
VSSYGEFGSLVLSPLGMAAAGPAAAAIGIDTALWLNVVISLAMIGTSAALPSVRATRALGREPEPAVA